LHGLICSILFIYEELPFRLYYEEKQRATFRYS